MLCIQGMNFVRTFVISYFTASGKICKQKCKYYMPTTMSPHRFSFYTDDVNFSLYWMKRVSGNEKLCQERNSSPL